MDIEQAIDLIRRKEEFYDDAIKRRNLCRSYYYMDGDINRFPKNASQKNGDIRTADNRIPSAFYPLLVDQKTSYLFTKRILFDVDNSEYNKKIFDTLGDKWPKVCQELCVEASNATVAWLHYWTDDNGFHYAPVPYVFPEYSTDLEQRLVRVLREYVMLDEENGKEYDVYEIWDDTHCYAFYKDRKNTIEFLEPYNEFWYRTIIDPEDADSTNVFEHGYGRVPFIPCYNNAAHTDDLLRVKAHIDAYDKVNSGLMNDLEDIQEVILILKDYAGEDLGSFHETLKEYKVISVETEETPNAGVETLNIEIPVQAREMALKHYRKSIFEDGMGVDTNPENYGDVSGVALKYLYSLLELKAGLMETEFRQGFAELVKAIIRYYFGKDIESVVQVWGRNGVRNDYETAQIAQLSLGIVSQETLVANHPFVDDVETELERLKNSDTDLTQSYYGQTPHLKDESQALAEHPLD